MKKYVLVITASLVITLYSSFSFALMYDFESPAASILNGNASGTYVVDSTPLQVLAGSMTSGGDFTLGGNSATIHIASPGSIPSVSRGGIGVNSSVSSGSIDEMLTKDEGVVFNFDSLFTPEKIHITRSNSFNGIRLFADGVFLLDILGDAEADKTIFLSDSISSLSVATLLGTGLSSDPALLITSIEGSVVPEPSIITLFAAGLFGLGFARRNNA